MSEIKIRTATIEDSRAVGELYLTSFPESVDFFFDSGDAARVSTIAACGFEMVLRVACLPLVAYDGQGRLVGYCIVSTRNGLPFYRLLLPKNLGRVLQLCFVALACLKGKELRKLGKNLLSPADRTGDDIPKRLAGGRIISIAVHPAARGLGLGRMLLAQGLNFLEERHIPATYLEVRPNNLHAKRLYESTGFYAYGDTRDLQGGWIRMVRKNNAGDGAGNGL